MRALLVTIVDNEPITYAAILAAHEPARPCRVSNSLKRLETSGYITYVMDGRPEYLATDKGKETLNESDA